MKFLNWMDYRIKVNLKFCICVKIKYRRWVVLLRPWLLCHTLIYGALDLLSMLLIRLRKLTRNLFFCRSNLVENVSEIDHLKELPKLKHLNLMDNPICQIANYRIEVLSRIPHLEQLDKNQFTVEEKEAASNLQVEREKAAANAGAAEDQAA